MKRSTKERAILVHINFPAGVMQEDLREFQDLARSAGADPVEIITGTRSVADAKYFVGSGKAEQIRVAVNVTGAKLVIFNHALSPSQERNLERLIQARVVDRTGLILDIFAERARSFEGKLQVELALLKHLATRLVRGWTHLERQRGGIGLRGPGETQLETDRRLIRTRIQYISKRLNKVKKQRDQSRQSRRKAMIPTVALVGYTNAGKSTLFNCLTGADAYVADRLFATLDPTLRRITLPEVGPVILADTVGFIRHLPHDLVEAFHATLEEVAEADLLLHVIDVYDENRQANISQVDEVLKSIGADIVPKILVFNKIDLGDLEAKMAFFPESDIARVYISAEKNMGITQLESLMMRFLGEDILERAITLEAKDSKLRAKLYRLEAIVSEQIDEEGRFHLRIRMPRVEMEKIFGGQFL